jgi:hypothetical protein
MCLVSAIELEGKLPQGLAVQGKVLMDGRERR